MIGLLLEKLAKGVIFSLGNFLIMWNKFRFHFNSSALMTFFILSALGFAVLLCAIWSISIKSERVANLKRDGNQIINGITGSIFGSAELDSQGLETESRTLIQDYLDSTLDRKATEFQLSSIVKISVYTLSTERSTQIKRVIGEWDSDLALNRDCVERHTEYIQPPHSPYTYLVDVHQNICMPTRWSFFQYHALKIPVIVALLVILVWGGCIYAMMHSVSFAGKLLGSSADTAELLDKTSRILWTNVETLAARALQVRDKNLQYYHTLILDAQHDISKILDIIDNRYEDKDLNTSVSTARGIVQKLVAEVRSSELPYNDVTAHRDVDREELLALMKTYYANDMIRSSLPQGFSLYVSDISLFERILINLSSNAFLHSIERPRVEILFYDNWFRLRIYTVVPLYQSIKLHLAKWTKRLDVKNTMTPVYIKLFGRTGRGLSIIKRGSMKLGGRMVFDIQKNIVQTGIDLPATVTLPKAADTPFFQKEKKRIILFEKQEFIQAAIHHGLESFLVKKEDLNRLIAEHEQLEVVSDIEISLPSQATLRILSKKERLEGIAINWLKKV